MRIHYILADDGEYYAKATQPIMGTVWISDDQTWDFPPWNSWTIVDYNRVPIERKRALEYAIDGFLDGKEGEK